VALLVASAMHVAISNDGEKAFYAQLPATKRLAWLPWTVSQSDSGSWLSLLTHCLFPTPHMGITESQTVRGWKGPLWVI